MADAIIIIAEKSWIVCSIAIYVIIINYLKNKEYNNQKEIFK
jgi:hypothetical protein